jgi:hypothetical protein
MFLRVNLRNVIFLKADDTIAEKVITPSNVFTDDYWRELVL